MGGVRQNNEMQLTKRAADSGRVSQLISVLSRHEDVEVGRAMRRALWATTISWIACTALSCYKQEPQVASGVTREAMSRVTLGMQDSEVTSLLGTPLSAYVRSESGVETTTLIYAMS